MIRNFRNEIEQFTIKCIEYGLCLHQNKPIIRNNSIIVWAGETGITSALKNSRYLEKYEETRNSQNYNLLMADGALIQLRYLFSHDRRKVLIKHSLSFLPKPTGISLQEIPEEEEIEESAFVDIIPIPLRFDYDGESHADMEHPKSHLHIGEFRNCRIPVCSPIRPITFFHFILRSFYYKDFNENFDDGFFIRDRIEKTITSSEAKLLHINIV